MTSFVMLKSDSIPWSKNKESESNAGVCAVMFIGLQRLWWLQSIYPRLSTRHNNWFEPCEPPIFAYQKMNYILLLIRQMHVNPILKSRQIGVITIASVAVLLTLSTVYSGFDIIQAFAGETLSNDNVAKAILVRINPTGTNVVYPFDSFSRIGFVDGEGNFLLESVPSMDKKPFYSLVKKSLDAKTLTSKNKGMDVSIDIFSGNGEIIETLKYNKCDVTEYFVHGVDSLGKIWFVENTGSVEIREVTKFECVSLTLEINYSEEDIVQVEKIISANTRSPFEYEGNDPYFSTPATNGTEGELFYNSDTNKLQKFVKGEWVDISGPGGPPSPRR